MFKIPTITKHLLILNVLAYLLMELLKAITLGSANPIDLNDILGLHFFMAKDFHFYQLFTYMFMHGGLHHIFFNMFALWMFGCVVENVWGARKFLLYYILCGVGAGLFQEMAQFVNYAVEGYAAYSYITDGTVKMPMEAFLNQWTTVGASGSVYAILLAFGMTFPEQRIFIFPLPVPIKAKWFVIIYAAIELFSAMSTTNDGVAHVAHLGGMVFGYVLIRYWRSQAQRIHNGQSRPFFRFKTPQYSNPSSTQQQDWDYNAQQSQLQREIDVILDKIRRSGYDSLSIEEKQKLFDFSNKRR